MLWNVGVADLQSLIASAVAETEEVKNKSHKFIVDFASLMLATKPF